jgi:hypothetical protein
MPKASLVRMATVSGESALPTLTIPPLGYAASF